MILYCLMFDFKPEKSRNGPLFSEETPCRLTFGSSPLSSKKAPVDFLKARFWSVSTGGRSSRDFVSSFRSLCERLSRLQRLACVQPPLDRTGAAVHRLSALTQSTIGKSKAPAVYPNNNCSNRKIAPARFFFYPLPYVTTAQRDLCGLGERKLPLNLDIIGDCLLKEGFELSS